MWGKARIVVEGPGGAGKTSFIERLLESNQSRLISTIRARTDEEIADPVLDESGNEETRRLLDAGADEAALVRVPVDPDYAAVTAICEAPPFGCYGHAVVLELDQELPLDADLHVFVTRPLPPGEPFLARRPQEIAVDANAIAFLLEEELDPKSRRLLREAMEEESEIIFLGEDRWSLPDTHQALVRADLVLVNVEEGPEAADRTVAEIALMRKDGEIARDLEASPLRRALRTTVRVADLSDPKDPELRRALATVKRKMPSGEREPDGWF